MGHAGEYLLLGTTVATALFHTLIPDHWLPFVLMGRARGWSLRTTAALSTLSAAIHTLLSVALGLAAVFVGHETALAVGQSLESMGGVLLVLFGLGYAAWSWRKGGHFHPGGARMHGHADARACSGEEGPANPSHLHYHADDALIRGRTDRGGLYLAVIVGANPCVLILPLLLAALDRGPEAIVAVSLSYSVTTTALMVALSVVGVAGTRMLRVPGIARYMEAASGMLIALLGAALLLLEHG